MTVKKVFLITSLVVVAVVLSVSFWAACSPGRIIANAALGGQQTITGTVGTTIRAKYWEVGQGTVNNSGTLADTTMTQSCGAGCFKVFSNWGNTGVNGCPTGCPACTGRTAFLYSVANGGTGQYLLMSTTYNSTSSWYDFGAIGPGSTLTPLNIPQPTVTNVTGSGPYTVTITWTPIANLKGNFNTDPGVNLITGVAVRYYTGVAAPTDYTTGAWTLATTGGSVQWGTAGVDPGTATFTVPAPTAGNGLWVALSLLFDGQVPTADKAQSFLETNFVGALRAVSNPTGGGVFGDASASMLGGQISVVWHSNVESNVAKYEVYWGPKKTGPFQVVATVPPEGNSHGYRVTFTPPGVVNPQAQYVKIKALKTDGTDEWSQLLRVGGGTRP